MKVIDIKNRINERIRTPRVRVIDFDGSQLGVLTIQEALQISRTRELDLVEVSPNSDPPVCKIMDFGKFKYQQKKKLHEAKKKQTIIKVKEVKLSPRTDRHDLQFKLQHIKRFLEEGNKAKISVVFKGREIVHSELGKQMLQRILDEIKDISIMEQNPKMEGRSLTTVVAPK